MNLTVLVAIGLALANPRLEETTYKIAPKLGVGQELEYRGAMVRSTLGGEGARYEQPYDLETTMLVLDVDAKRVAEVGCYTVLRLQDHGFSRSKGSLEGAVQVHFGLVKVAPTGKTSWAESGAEIALSPNADVPFELGFLIETPEEAVSTGTSWVAIRAGEPNVRCRVLGTEKLGSVQCVKIAMNQESPNWENPHHALPAWRRETTAWMDAREGVVYRYERTQEIRPAGAEEPSRRVDVKMKLSSNLRFHGPLFIERSADFRAAYKMQSGLERALARLEKTPPSRIESLRQEMKYTLDKPYRTPYRPAMERMMAQAEAAAKEAGRPSVEPATARRSLPDPVGRKARPFTVRCVETNQTITLKEIAGKPTILLFVEPESSLAARSIRATLDAMQPLGAGAPDLLVVAKDADEEKIAAMREQAPGKYSVCTGSALDRRQGVSGSPHLLYIDAQGVVRASVSGFGQEFRADLEKALAEKPAPAGPPAGAARSDAKKNFLR